jgi:hypothetical protein
MNRPELYVDFDKLIREARMERSMAIGNAIAGVIAAASRGIERAIALLFHEDPPKQAEQPRG